MTGSQKIKVKAIVRNHANKGSLSPDDYGEAEKELRAVGITDAEVETWLEFLYEETGALESKNNRIADLEKEIERLSELLFKSKIVHIGPNYMGDVDNRRTDVKGDAIGTSFGDQSHTETGDIRKESGGSEGRI